MIDPVDARAPQTWRACAELFGLVPQKTNGHVVAARYLRAAADEVDRLRDRAVDDAKDRERLRVNFNARSAEASRLRAVIENAPHGDDCIWPHGDQHPDAQGSYCTCWKADAL